MAIKRKEIYEKMEGLCQNIGKYYERVDRFADKHPNLLIGTSMALLLSGGIYIDSNEYVLGGLFSVTGILFGLRAIPTSQACKELRLYKD